MKPRSVLIYTRYPHHYSRWLANLGKFLRSCGFEVHIKQFSPPRQFFERMVPKCRHVIIWNGEEACHVPVKQICSQTGVPLSIAEVGYFPQSAFYILDKMGINANSELMLDTLDWVSEEMLLRADAFAAEYLGDRQWSRCNRYILCPLQLEGDTNIRLHSPFKKMQQLVEHVEGQFPDKQIWFKTHPRALHQRLKVGTNSRVIRGGSILDIAVDAEVVVGVNSTSLLETTLMGIPTIALGSGLLKRHKGDERRLLAALIDKQIPVAEENVGYWLQKYAGFCLAE